MEERPLECSSCKRKATITFKEIAEGKTCSTRMCSECPYLQSKVGMPCNGPIDTKHSIEGSYCKNCQTTHQSLLIGEGVGCEKCYDVFEAAIIDGLKSSHAIPNECVTSSSFHFGCVQESPQSDSSLKLETLNKALSEALRLENYEQAASLRDQIKTLMDGPYG